MRSRFTFSIDYMFYTTHLLFDSPINLFTLKLLHTTNYISLLATNEVFTYQQRTYYVTTERNNSISMLTDLSTTR